MKYGALPFLEHGGVQRHYPIHGEEKSVTVTGMQECVLFDWPIQG